MASIVVSRRRRGASSPGPRPTGSCCASSSSSDRLFAAYAICDLDDREFSRTRWGGAFVGTDLVAVALEYAGLSPQPLFVMGRNDGIEAALRDLVKPRAAYVAALPTALPRRRDQLPGRSRARRWSGCGSTARTFRPYPADTSRGSCPIEIGELNRLYQLGFASWLPASGAIADGRLLRRPRQRPARRRGGDPRDQPDGPAGGRRQRPDPGRVPRPRLRDGRPPAPSRPSCCASATRSCSTSGPTIRRRSRPIAGSATRSTSASRSA